MTYREEAPELASREKLLEQELAATRTQLHALADEERRLSRALAEVRGELAALGRVKVIEARPESSRNARAMAVLMLAFVALVAADWLRRTNTAVRPPPDVSSPWGGPTASGRGWLYLEAPPNTVVKVDGDFAAAPTRLDLSVLDGHDFEFDARAKTRVHPIPCTTAVVRYHGSGFVDVDRFFNSATCF